MILPTVDAKSWGSPGASCVKFGKLFMRAAQLCAPCKRSAGRFASGDKLMCLIFSGPKSLLQIFNPSCCPNSSNILASHYPDQNPHCHHYGCCHANTDSNLHPNWNIGVISLRSYVFMGSRTRRDLALGGGYLWSKVPRFPAYWNALGIGAVCSCFVYNKLICSLFV